MTTSFMPDRPTRRRLLKTAAGSAAGALLLPRINAAEPAVQPKAVRFGLVTDIHHHLAPDAERRLEAFLRQLEQWRPDFVLQLGDFTHKPRQSKSFYHIWKQFDGPRYHVLGNHDMDEEPKRTTLDAWEMRRGYYSFDAGPFHFVVLDANHLKLDDKYVDYDRGNYFRHPKARGFVTPDQLEWLADDLRKSNRSTIVFSHQALDSYGSVANAAQVRSALDRHNSTTKQGRVVACLCGHHHIDDHQTADDIHYLQINSASYHWVGSKYANSGMAPYRDPLFALVTLDASGEMSISGRASSFVPPTPREMSHPNANALTARISNRRIPLATSS